MMPRGKVVFLLEVKNTPRIVPIRVFKNKVVAEKRHGHQGEPSCRKTCRTIDAP